MKTFLLERFSHRAATVIFTLSIMSLAITAAALNTSSVLKQQTNSLKQFEGIYQNDENSEAAIQFFVRGENLVGKLLWNDLEYVMVKKSDLEFVSEDEEYPAKFIKNESGEIIKVILLNRGQWTKVKDYKPRKPAELSAEQLKRFEGKYQFQDDANATLQITAKENSLMVKQMWDGREIVILPQSELEFYGKDESFPATFIKDDEGKITRLLCFNKDVWEKLGE